MDPGRSDFADKYPELVVAYLKATLRRTADPRHSGRLCTKVAEWKTGSRARKRSSYMGHGNKVFQNPRDYTVKPEYVEAILEGREKSGIEGKTDQPVGAARFSRII